MFKNLFHLPEEMNGTELSPQDQPDINNQRALWVTIIFTTVAVTVFGVSLFLVFQNPAWQVLLMAVISGFSLAGYIYSVVLIRRRQSALALSIIYWSILFVFPLNALLFSGLTPIIIGLVLAMGFTEVVLLFPPTRRKVLQFGPVVSALVIGLIELINPSFRFAMGSIALIARYVGPAELVFVVVGFIVLVISQRMILAGFLANISMAWKMVLMVAVLFLGMAGITVSAYIGMQSMRYQFSNMYDFMLVPITSIEEADTALVGSQYFLVQVLREDITAEERANGVAQIQADNQSAEEVITRYDTEWATTTSPQFTQDLTNAGKLDLQKQEVATLASYHTAFAAYKTAVAKYLATVQAGNPDAALANETITKLEAAHTELRKLIDVNNQFADFSNTSAQAAIQRALLNGGIALGISVLLGFLMSYLIVISITGRLHNLTRTAAALQAGNLDQTVAEAGHDEISLLGTTFNKMTAQLSEFIGTLEQRVAERTKALATVAEVSTATATILEPDRLLQEVVDLTKERFNLYHSHIYLLDKAGENLVLASGAGEPGRQMMAKGLSIALNREQSLVARAARERKGVTVNDVTQAPDFLPNPLLPNTRSELAVPMIAGENVIGVFDIQSDAVGRFTESDISIQTTLAAQVAISIQNARSFEQSKTRAELETLVNTIGQKIQRTTTVEDTLQTAIRELGLAIGASHVKATIQAAHPDTPERKNTSEVEYA